MLFKPILWAVKLEAQRFVAGKLFLKMKFEISGLPFYSSPLSTVLIKSTDRSCNVKCMCSVRIQLNK